MSSEQQGRAIHLDLIRYDIDTYDEVVRFWEDRAKTIPLDLTGRTFAAHVILGGTEVFAMTAVVGGASNNEVTMTPVAPGAWGDLEVGKKYRWSMWETTTVNVTLFEGELRVQDR